MKRFLPLLILAALAAGVWFLVQNRNRPPEVEFVKIQRHRLVELLNTNGRVEPVEWAAARADTTGAVEKILIQKGQNIAAGAAIVELDAKEMRAAVDSADARVAQAKADLEVLTRGGRSADIAAIDAQLSGARQELSAASRELTVVKNLAAKQAATGYEVTLAQERVDRTNTQITSLLDRRSALVAPPDKAAAEARLRDAEAAARLARQQLALATVRAPIAGKIYQFDLKPGAFLTRGDTVASIGRLETVRALIYVDEPELGRVEPGKAVAITWDAMPGRTWNGTVEKMPTQITPLGNRQVGEVQCRIQNPGADLLPGSNITAAIRVAAVEDAVALPKVTLRREDGETGVLLLDQANQKLVWRAIKTGISSATDTQVVSGLQAGDWVALPPSDRAIRADMPVTPVLK